MFKYVIAFALLATAYAVTPVSQCESGIALPDEVDFNGCTGEPCSIPTGETATMNITFTAPQELGSAFVDVVAFALGIQTPYPIPENAVCDLLTDNQCPLAEGEQSTFTVSMDILDIFPQIAVDLEFTMTDAPGGSLNCFRVRTQVV